MANPFMGPVDHSAYTGPPTDHYGDDYTIMCVYHVAALMLLGVGILVALKMSGFRAMVGVGRG